MRTHFILSRALSTALVALSAPVVAFAKPASHAIEGIEARQTATGREVVIKTAGGAPTFSVFRLADPFRVLVDVNESSAPDALALTRHDGDGVLRYVAAQTFSDELSSIARVEIGLEAEIPFDVETSGNSIVVHITAPNGKPSAKSAPAEKSESSAAAPQGTVLGKLSKQSRGKSVLLVAPLNGPAPSSDAVVIQHVADPDRLVVDIAGVSADPKWQKLAVKQRGIDRARLGSTDTGIRVVLDLVKGAPLPEVTVDAEKNQLAIALSPAKKPVPAEAVVAKIEPEPAVAQPAAKPEPKVEAKAQSKPTNEVTDVRFEQKDGFVRLVVELKKAFTPVKDSASTRGTPVLRVASTALPEALARTLDTSAVAGHVVDSISTYAESGDLMIVAKVGEDAEHRHWQKDNKLFWDFRSKSGAIVTAAQPEAAAPVEPKVLDYPAKATAGYQSQLAARTAAETHPSARYSGRRISLDLKDADIQNVLRLLADVSKLNIVASEDVKGKITLKLRNVPWDQALDIILQSKQLDKVRNGNIIRVAPLEVLEKEEQLRLSRKEAIEKLAPLSVRLVPVSYAVAKDIKPQLTPLLSSRGKVNIDDRTNVLIIEDIPEILLKVERLVRTLDTQTPQVLIEARIVQALSNWGRDVGIQWGGEMNFDRAHGNDTGLNFPNSIRVRGGSGQGANDGVSALPDFAVNLPAATGLGSGGSLGFVFGSVGGGTLLNLRLTAAERDGRAKIVSSPKVVTLDNKKAKILSGEKVPITVLTANGPTTRFIDANLELEVTPHVTSDGSVLLQLKATQNQVNEQRRDILGTPGIIVREAETQMLVKDGDTAVLGGIYRRNAAESRFYVPFFGDIPVLGWLFKRTNRTDDRDELLIFISPRIVNRSEALVQGS